MPATTKNTTAPTPGKKSIQLYSLGTPNGQKIGIALEERGLEYNAHIIDIRKGTQFEEWFTAINPNAKIPAIVDQKPLGGKTEPLTVFESAAILIYLADKTGKFLATNGTRQRYETLEWLMWKIGGIGPTLVQSFYFYKMAKERFMTEAKRLLTILDTQLAKTKTFVSGTDYTIADMAIYHWTVHFSIQYQDQFEQNKYSYKLLRDLMRVRVCGYCY